MQGPVAPRNDSRLSVAQVRLLREPEEAALLPGSGEDFDRAEVSQVLAAAVSLQRSRVSSSLPLFWRASIVGSFGRQGHAATPLMHPHPAVPPPLQLVADLMGGSGLSTCPRAVARLLGAFAPAAVSVFSSRLRIRATEHALEHCLPSRDALASGPLGCTTAFALYPYDGLQRHDIAGRVLASRCRTCSSARLQKNPLRELGGRWLLFGMPTACCGVAYRA